jgi:hypothetical protein
VRRLILTLAVISLLSGVVASAITSPAAHSSLKPTAARELARIEATTGETPEIICDPGVTCGDPEYFLPGQWWVYDLDQGRYWSGLWHEEDNAEGAFIGCVFSGTVAGLIPVEGWLYWAGVSAACVAGGYLGWFGT